MLDTKSEFPQPGSYAFLGERRVRIIQQTRDGRLLVAPVDGRAPGRASTVRLFELVPASPLTRGQA